MSAAPKPRRSGISKDPFYAQIVAGLDHEHLDPGCFQRCMADLLRDSLPNLVPITGSSDGGWDGAIADGRGEPFALACTTSDVKRNLEKNLDSLKRGAALRRKVVVATSQRLTPAQREKLKGAAKDRGFTLVQIFDQEAVADRLYHDPVWCKRLLGISGTPSPLTSNPPSHRPSFEIPLIGRDADAEWVKTTPGDLVLAGQPGSGKTYLLRSLVRQGWNAQFLTREEPTAIANALRQQRPAAVIVDDADSDPFPFRLEVLARLRQTHDFTIVATTWEGGRDQVVQDLGGLPAAHVRTLELLTRQQILEIIKAVGVEASERVLRELVDQAANRPGLAVTIASLWLQGSWQAVLEGRVLSQALLARLRKLLRRDAPEDILAALSLGGERGMSLETVGEQLHMSVPEIRRSMVDLAMAGVLSEVSGGALAVQPGQFRSFLIRAVYFPDGPVRPDYRGILAAVPDRDSAVEALTAARARGAAIPEDELRQLVLRSSSHRIWSGFAQLDEGCAQWALENYAGDVGDIAPSALRAAPRATIPRILERAGTAVRSGEMRSGVPDQALSHLMRWVKDLEAGPAEGLSRRWMVARAAKQYLARGGDLAVGTEGIFLSLTPSVEGSTLDPGIGDTVNLRFGLLPLKHLLEIEEIWKEVRGAIGTIDRSNWQHVSAALWEWIYPQYAAKSAQVSEETRRSMRDFAALVLRDLCPLAEGKPGISAGLRGLAARIALDLPVPADPVFDLLYAEGDAEPGAKQAPVASRREELEKVAETWAQAPPSTVAAKLAFYEQQAEMIGQQWDPKVVELCRMLAPEVEDPEAWLDAFLEVDRRGRLAPAFLEEIVRHAGSGWETRLEKCLELRSLEWPATSLILQHPAPPRSLLQRALSAADGLPTLVDTLCLRREVPLPTLRLLLQLPTSAAAASAAIGEWASDPKGTVREEVGPEWRSAILRAKTKDYDTASGAERIQYWLGVILAQDAGLAFDWLQARLGDPDLPGYFMEDSPFALALGALCYEQRVKLLEALEAAPILESLLPLLIGRHGELYERLLSTERLKGYHLAPLKGQPDESWAMLAERALKAGHDPADIAAISFAGGGGFVGSGLEHWTHWERAFAALEDSDTKDLREVARRGKAMAREFLDQARLRQRHVEIHGLAGR
jgi:hypothetical protein